ncbi:hypothetical protein FE257_003100 [Aspergillus nanangensis]|uniref:Uncharacterized protein n=1 Tax=Aspergillus nanangensis TaxID=2582783 RepID=A0AAD4CC00_ASPNN|nr:hypothetical protein FE257_003100 [Aspergillus nanangensis]
MREGSCRDAPEDRVQGRHYYKVTIRLLPSELHAYGLFTNASFRIQTDRMYVARSIIRESIRDGVLEVFVRGIACPAPPADSAFCMHCPPHFPEYDPGIIVPVEINYGLDVTPSVAMPPSVLSAIRYVLRRAHSRRTIDISKHVASSVVVSPCCAVGGRETRPFQQEFRIYSRSSTIWASNGEDADDIHERFAAELHSALAPFQVLAKCLLGIQQTRLSGRDPADLLPIRSIFLCYYFSLMTEQMDIDESPRTRGHPSATIIGPIDPDESFNEPCGRRKELLNQLQATINKDVPLAFWAILTVCDIENLENIKVAKIQSQHPLTCAFSCGYMRGMDLFCLAKCILAEIVASLGADYPGVPKCPGTLEVTVSEEEQFIVVRYDRHRSAFGEYRYGGHKHCLITVPTQHHLSVLSLSSGHKHGLHINLAICIVLTTYATWTARTIATTLVPKPLSRLQQALADIQKEEDIDQSQDKGTGSGGNPPQTLREFTSTCPPFFGRVICDERHAAKTIASQVHQSIAQLHAAHV